MMQIAYSWIRRAFTCVSSMNTKLEVEKLDRIYVCAYCKSVFLFKSDIMDHKEMSGHDDVKAMPFT